MKLNVKQIEQLDAKQVYNILEKEINNIFNNYIYFDIKIDEYKVIVLNIIEDTIITYNNAMLYEKYVVGEILNYLNNLTSQYLHSEKGIMVITNFINKRFKKVLTLENAKYNYKILGEFFKKNNYKMPLNVREALLKKSELFLEMTNMLKEEQNREENISMLDKNYDESEMILDNSVGMYLRSLRGIKVLSAEEEKELAIKALQGDNIARNEFIVHNLKLVVNIAKKYVDDKNELEDLIQAGNLGMLHALEKFDPTKGFKFSTYASRWIEKQITKYKVNNNFFRSSMYTNQLQKTYRKIVNELEIEYGRYPTKKEIADEMNLKEEQVRRLEIMHKEVISLNFKKNSEQDTEIEELISSNELTPEEELINKVDNYIIKEILNNKNLNDREKLVIALRCGFIHNKPLNLNEISLILNVSSERVRQIFNSGIAKIRKNPLVRELRK